MMAGCGGGEGMVPERRQEHVPYLYSLRGSFFMFVESGCISKDIEFTVPYVYIF